MTDAHTLATNILNISYDLIHLQALQLIPLTCLTMLQVCLGQENSPAEAALCFTMDCTIIRMNNLPERFGGHRVNMYSLIRKVVWTLKAEIFILKTTKIFEMHAL